MFPDRVQHEKDPSSHLRRQSLLFLQALQAERDGTQSDWPSSLNVKELFFSSVQVFTGTFLINWFGS